MGKPIRDKERNQDTGFLYDIISICDNNSANCGKAIMIYNTSSTCALQYDLISGSLIDGRDTASADDIATADYYVQEYLREWQAEVGLRKYVRFTEDSDCYYDYTSTYLYNAKGKKNGKEINGKRVQFSSHQQCIIEYLINMSGYACSYDAISLAVTGAVCDYGMQPNNIQVQINAIKGYDSCAIRPFIKSVTVTTGTACKGYIYTGRKPEWTYGDVNFSKSGSAYSYRSESASTESFVEAELSDVKAKLANLVESLVKREDIFLDLQNMISICRRLQSAKSKDFVLKKIRICKKLAYQSGKYDDRTLSFLEYLEDYISVHIRLTEICREIGNTTEDLYAARTIEQRRRMHRAIVDNQKRFEKELDSLMEYDQELERLQRDGISKDSILSLSRPNYSTEP